MIHAIYRLGGAVNIDKHYRTGEGSEEKISVVGHVEPEQGGVGQNRGEGKGLKIPIREQVARRLPGKGLTDFNDLARPRSWA